jgi:hypothetical protein
MKKVTSNLKKSSSVGPGNQKALSSFISEDESFNKAETHQPPAAELDSNKAALSSVSVLGKRKATQLPQREDASKKKLVPA